MRVIAIIVAFMTGTGVIRLSRSRGRMRLEPRIQYLTDAYGCFFLAVFMATAPTAFAIEDMTIRGATAILSILASVAGVILLVIRARLPR